MSQLVFTTDACVGCNRCIGACSCQGANIAQNNNEIRIIDSTKKGVKFSE